METLAITTALCKIRHQIFLMALDQCILCLALSLVTSIPSGQLRHQILFMFLELGMMPLSPYVPVMIVRSKPITLIWLKPLKLVSSALINLRSLRPIEVALRSSVLSRVEYSIPCSKLVQ
jgi:hypothetical protein